MDRSSTGAAFQSSEPYDRPRGRDDERPPVTAAREPRDTAESDGVASGAPSSREGRSERLYGEVRALPAMAASAGAAAAFDGSVAEAPGVAAGAEPLGIAIPAGNDGGWPPWPAPPWYHGIQAGAVAVAPAPGGGTIGAPPCMNA